MRSGDRSRGDLKAKGDKGGSTGKRERRGSKISDFKTDRSHPKDFFSNVTRKCNLEKRFSMASNRLKNSGYKGLSIGLNSKEDRIQLDDKEECLYSDKVLLVKQSSLRNKVVENVMEREFAFKRSRREQKLDDEKSTVLYQFKSRMEEEKNDLVSMLEIGDLIKLDDFLVNFMP